MEVGPKNVVLIIKKAEKSDEGPYKVELENDQGSTTAETKVKVLSEYYVFIDKMRFLLQHFVFQSDIHRRSYPHAYVHGCSGVTYD